MAIKRASKATFMVAAIPAGVALNVVANTIVKATGLPLFLNNIGSMFNAIVLGPLYGTLTALLTNTVISLTSTWTYFSYTLVGIVVALFAYVYHKCGWLRGFPGILMCGVLTGLIACAMSAVVTAFFFGGASQGLISVVVGGLIATGQSIFSANFIASLPGEMIDKTIALWACVQIMKMLPDRLMPNAAFIKSMLKPRVKNKAASET